MLVWILIIVGVVILDQGTKLLMMNLLPNVKDTIPIIQDFFHFTHVRNTGMAFGMMKDHRWVFMVFSTVAIVGLAGYLFRFRPESRWMQVSMAMIIGGGVGNMIDRIVLGYVVDFIDFTLIDFAVFNIADSFVCVGAGIMMLCLILDLVKEIKLEKAQKAEAAKTPEENNKNDTTVE